MREQRRTHCESYEIKNIITMTKLKLILGFAITAFIAGQSVQAVPIQYISGSVGFDGTWSGDGADINSHNNVTLIGAQVQGNGTGTFASLTDGTAANFSVIDLNATSGSIWTAGNFSFVAVNYTVTRIQNAILAITGAGYASAAGHQNSYGMFTLSLGQSGQSMTFQSTADVPDSGTTTALLGLGLIGLAGAARRFKK
jgi:hypothetical protein